MMSVIIRGAVARRSGFIIHNSVLSLTRPGKRPAPVLKL
jgi:hypothetical protein